ncbi:MAG TPA: GDSL-type esterase/lipase family protein [Opitutales bacterium]|jgi:rhamnogalacturonan acetylesterase|nr:GDSL-type esterase/lipase family protein [Opitutales bacterium]
MKKSSLSLPPLRAIFGPRLVAAWVAALLVGACAQVPPPAVQSTAPAAPVTQAAPAQPASVAPIAPAPTIAQTAPDRLVVTGTDAPKFAPIDPLERDKLPFTPATFKSVNPNLPTLVVAGDSTAQAGDPNHRGWAALLVDYFDTSKINLVNPSIGGRSFRSFYHEGHWDDVVKGLKPGDIVMIQFGHNDGGNAATDTKGRADVQGDGDATVEGVDSKGQPETVHTLGWYLRTYIADTRSKGAIPYVMSATPYNRWANGMFRHLPGDLSATQIPIAKELNVPYFDHTTMITDRFDAMGQDEVSKLFFTDNLHTRTAGAIYNAEAFIAGIKAMHIQVLMDALNDRGKAIPAFVPTAAPAP